MLFSIVIPLFNKKDQVSDAIQSVLAQSFADFELIVVDDGSTDGSAEIARLIQDDRLCIIHQKNGGVSAARNTGIKKATGEYICFLDADDLWLKNHLESLVILIQRFPKAGLFVTLYRIIESDGTIKDLPKFKSEYILVNDFFDLMLSTGYTFIHTNSVCIPRTIFNEIGLFVVGEKTGEDTSVWFRVAAKHDVAIINEVTTLYRRQYSNAFIGVSLNPYWSFIEIAENSILPDNNIPITKRENIKKQINHYRHSLCRHYLLEGKCADAKKLYTELRWDWLGKKAKLVTDICFLVPYKLLEWIYLRKYHYSFRK